MSERKNPVRLTRGPLSGKVFALTSYKVVDAERDVLEARTKHDVTEDFELMAAPLLAEAVARGRKSQGTSAEEVAVSMLATISLKESSPLSRSGRTGEMA